MATSRSPSQRLRALRESLELAGELADALETQAARVREHCRELQGVLADLPDLPEAPEAPLATTPGAPATGSRREDDPIRIAAMEMALSGQSRQAAAEYLWATFSQDDVEKVLDEVYAERG